MEKYYLSNFEYFNVFERVYSSLFNKEYPPKRFGLVVNGNSISLGERSYVYIFSKEEVYGILNKMSENTKIKNLLEDILNKFNAPLRRVEGIYSIPLDIIVVRGRENSEERMNTINHEIVHAIIFGYLHGMSNNLEEFLKNFEKVRDLIILAGGEIEKLTDNFLYTKKEIFIVWLFRLIHNYFINKDACLRDIQLCYIKDRI